MGLLSNIFKKEETEKVGGMEDFMTLVRVYFQSSLASTLGINNVQALPDMMAFKRSLHIPTAAGRLGVAEKKACKEMMTNLYRLDEVFFQEIDASIKKNCRKQQDVPGYFYQFQGFVQEIMMLMGNLMKWKLRIPSFMKGMLRRLTEQQVAAVFTKQDWTDDATRISVSSVRRYLKTLGFSQAWTTEFVYHLMMLAKKEKQPSAEEMEAAKKRMKG